MAKKTPKTIYFYELVPKFDDNITKKIGNKELFNVLRKKIISNINKKSTSLFINHGGFNLLIDICQGDESDNLMKGVIRKFSNDSPEILNKKIYTSRDVEMEEDEGFVFSTHFVLKSSDKITMLAMEESKEAPHIFNLMYYFDKILSSVPGFFGIESIPDINDAINILPNDLIRCSEITLKVPQHNIEKLKEIDGDLYDSFSALKKLDSQPEYYTLALKYDYNILSDTKKMTNIFRKLANLIKKDESQMALFKKLAVKGESKSNNLKLALYDLLNGKKKVVIQAERRENSKAILYPNFLSAITIELNNAYPELK